MAVDVEHKHRQKQYNIDWGFRYSGARLTVRHVTKDGTKNEGNSIGRASSGRSRGLKAIFRQWLEEDSKDRRLPLAARLLHSSGACRPLSKSIKGSATRIRNDCSPGWGLVCRYEATMPEGDSNRKARLSCTFSPTVAANSLTASPTLLAVRPAAEASNSADYMQAQSCLSGSGFTAMTDQATGKVKDFPYQAVGLFFATTPSPLVLSRLRGNITSNFKSWRQSQAKHVEQGPRC